MKNIKETLEGIYNNPELRRTVVPLFMSNPGIGKSNIIEDFMKEKGVWIPPFVLSQRMPFEVTGMAMVDKERDIMKYYDFDFLNDLKDGSILFIDETTSSNPITLNAFLTFLESRVTVSGKALPDIMIVGAGNYQGILPLTPQVKERFVWYDEEFYEPMWIEFMVKKHALTEGICKELAKLIHGENFKSKSNNFNTPRSIDKAVNMIIHGVPTPYEDRVKPLLDVQVKNPFNGTVVLPDGTSMEPGDKISWLDLAKLKRKK